ncbi:MAG: hypothetical protein GY792_01490 [Gammaproteobacteria bacterium]|nr:hypothetical protein [Gammaproteobacteria bacterium]
MLRPVDIVGFSVPVVFRSKAQCAGNGCLPCQALQRHGGTPQARPKGWSVSAQGGVAPLAKGTAICCETRLALNADRPTEPDNISWTEHWGYRMRNTNPQCPDNFVVIINLETAVEREKDR